MSAIGYFMKRVKDCKDVSIMSSQDEQCMKTDKFTLFVYCNFLVVQPYAVKTKCEHNRRNSYGLQLSQ